MLDLRMNARAKSDFISLTDKVSTRENLSTSEIIPDCQPVCEKAFDFFMHIVNASPQVFQYPYGTANYSSFSSNQKTKEVGKGILNALNRISETSEDREIIAACLIHGNPFFQPSFEEKNLMGVEINFDWEEQSDLKNSVMTYGAFITMNESRETIHALINELPSNLRTALAYELSVIPLERFREYIPHTVWSTEDLLIVRSAYLAAVSNGKLCTPWP